MSDICNGEGFDVGRGMVSGDKVGAPNDDGGENTSHIREQTSSDGERHSLGQII